MSDPLGISIIVVNYNNDRFLAAAIDSALAQDHPFCEVIVVDDCSTDNSRAIIASYGDLIRSVLREINGHQIAALNSAWPLATYPILVFLDSDDVLSPQAASRIAAAWKPGTVKAQFLHASIESAGHPTGHIAPKYPANVDTAMIREELLRTGEPPSSPGSSNAYSRSLLERVAQDGGFDLDNLRWYWMDSILECNAPFYGEIVTIGEPLVWYRMHDRNLFFPNMIVYTRFATMARTFVLKVDYLAQRCRKWGILFDPAAACEHSLYLLQCQLAAAKLASAEEAVGEPVFRILRRGITACSATPMSPVFRVMFAIWFVAVAVVPRPVAAQLIALRFIPHQRPAFFERLINKMRSRHRLSQTQTMTR